MKFALLSDLHLEFSPYEDEFPDADALLLAGDIMVASLLQDHRTDKNSLRHKTYVKDLFQRAKDKFGTRVYYIPGNHEHYHGNIDTTIDIIEQFLVANGVYSLNMILDNDLVMFPNNENIILIGATLWSDFNGANPMSMMYVQQGMNDFRIISTGDGKSTFTPEDALFRHKKTVGFFEKAINALQENKIVVMGHHAPSERSIDTRYKGENLMNGGYMSNLEWLMKPNVRLWVHGHMHASNDYMVGETRVVSNARGYPDWHKKYENGNFNPKLVLEV